MEYLFVLAGGFALLFLIILISNKGKRTDHWVLALLLLLIIISSYYVFLLYHKDGEYYKPYFSELNYAIPLLYGVLLWFYSRSLLIRDFKFKRIDLLHFIPFLLFLGYVFYMMTNNEVETEHKMGYPLIKLIINPIYIFLTLNFLNRFTKKLQDKYSYDLQEHHYWLSWVAYGGLGLWIVACLGNVFNYLNEGHSNLLGDYFLVGFLALFLFTLAYVGFNRTKIFQAVQEDTQISMEEEGPQPVENNVDVDEYKELYGRLLQTMDSEKPYLDSQLSLHKLATSSKIPAGKLSMIINSHANQNFYDFINTYRVTLIKERLRSEDMELYSILGIAEECGFNSKASFNRVFKKMEGKTPTQYLKSLP